MESETVSQTSFLSCDSCRGWWLPHGSLTRLNETYRGAAVPIQIHEAELYTRAAARHRALNETFRDQPRFNKKRSNPQGIWFWVLFFGFAFVLGGLILVAGIGKAMKTTQWSQPLDQTLLYLAAGTVGGFGLFVYGWMVHQRKRLIESIPTSTIRSLALGLVEISGHAQPEEGLLSTPFGGLPCVFYSYAVEEQVGSEKTCTVGDHCQRHFGATLLCERYNRTSARRAPWRRAYLAGRAHLSKQLARRIAPHCNRRVESTGDFDRTLDGEQDITVPRIVHPTGRAGLRSRNGP